MTKSHTRKRRDIYQEVTDKMVKLIEKGVSPWRCNWSKYGAAKNYATGHFYTGINAILMNLTEHPIPFFMSFKQAQKLGGKIKKGAKAEIVCFYKTLYKDEKGNFYGRQKAIALAEMGVELETIPMLKHYNVFNVQDIEGIEIETPQVQLKQHEKIEACESIINGFSNPPEFICENANEAYYSVKRDKLNMPQMGQFKTAEAYYLTLFHELVHSTGHPKRLKREGLGQRFGNTKYSKEELIAEMGASFLSAQTGIDIEDLTENSAAYLKGWLSALKGDKKLIFKAAAEAQKAVDLITGIQRNYQD